MNDPHAHEDDGRHDEAALPGDDIIDAAEQAELDAADAKIDAEDRRRNGPKVDAEDDADDDHLPAKLDDDLTDELPPEDAAALGIDVDEFAEEAAAAEAARPPIATEALDFFDAAPEAHGLDSLTLEGRITVLERLGPAQFRSKGFSFIGFLQTVYEHVASETKVNATVSEPAAEGAPEPTPENPLADVSPQA